MGAGRDFSYVVPVRWADGEQRDELARYLRWLRDHCPEAIVVDGSPGQVFRANAAAWGAHATHLAPDPAEACLNGKVAGVRTGIHLASHDHVVIADDDVRYDAGSLRRTLELLDGHDLVRPQNYFDPLPWHACWDTARTLLNRSAGRDYPGTLAVRRSRLLAIGCYDGDVLFENLELIRTVRAAGGHIASPLDLYVARRPPTSSHFWNQRVRQAYDDFAIPARMATWLAIPPLFALAALRGRLRPLAIAAVLSMLVAERGRRRGGGGRVFPARASLLAPVWILERALCSWLAVAQRLRCGGVRYAGQRIRVAAHPEAELRRRHALRASAPP
ncbi:MAG: glycosyltransferase family 2 protein [Solirubrobacterales bacterium]